MKPWMVFAVLGFVLVAFVLFMAYQKQQSTAYLNELAAENSAQGFGILGDVVGGVRNLLNI